MPGLAFVAVATEHQCFWALDRLTGPHYEAVMKKLSNHFFLEAWNKVRSFFSPSKPQKSDLVEVCVFPLPNVVLIPGTGLPLHIFEERYKAMVEELLAKKTLLAMSLASLDNTGKMKPANVCGVGEVSVLQSFPDGRKDVLVHGSSRMRIVQVINEKPFMRAMAEPIPDLPYLSVTQESNDHQKLSELVRSWIFLSPDMDDSYLQYVDYFSKPHQMADFIASIFLSTGQDKQRFLEKTSRQERVKEIIHFINGRIQVLQTSGLQDLKMWEPDQKILH